MPDDLVLPNVLEMNTEEIYALSSVSGLTDLLAKTRLKDLIKSGWWALVGNVMTVNDTGAWFWIPKTALGKTIIYADEMVSGANTIADLLDDANTLLTTIQGDTTTSAGILTDVHDAANHRINTHNT